MHDGESKETGWVKVASGVALQVEWNVSDYVIAAHGDEELPGRLTGKVRMTRDAAFKANWEGGALVEEGEEGS